MEAQKGLAADVDSAAELAGRVAGKGAIAHEQARRNVQHAPAKLCISVCDGEAADHDGAEGGIDIKRAAGLVRVYGQIVRARAGDDHGLAHEQLAAGQRDGASDREVDEVEVVGAGERPTQRAGAAVIGVRYGDCCPESVNPLDARDRCAEQHEIGKEFVVSYHLF